MKRHRITGLRRRNFLVTAAATPLILATGGLKSSRVLAATPSCDDGATPRQTAGPFYKPQSPRRLSLIDPGMEGPRLKLTGRILSTSCQPVAGAVMDFWHCDADGNYDNRGFRFRGHQFSDAQGMFSLETLMPGIYPGRTRHIHVIVQAPNGRQLTTQLYFPGEEQNERDWIFDPALMMDIKKADAQRNARFNFVLDIGRSG
ncbi:MAG TPA: intradiol ring-cleavage dioxygenase [Burkholderiales bacterium]|nr:intradiol ring-cleavage dioxygenase [Burkholderiales bacterium]